MNIYDSILSFHGTWCTYQARVLEASQSYLEDKNYILWLLREQGKLHLALN